jgi:hypothetical protein
MGSDARAALERARARLDRLSLYPRPVRIERVRVVTLPWFFGLPWLRRYAGYTLIRTILLRRPLAQVSDDLLTHELCHVWQMQNEALKVIWAFFTRRYRSNPYEVEARAAVEQTRATGPSRSG